MKKLLCLIMDGVGESKNPFGNAVLNSNCPNLMSLRQQGLFTTLAAHGHAVGLPQTNDIGNSEVGHNAMGVGNIYDQGAKLVLHSIESGDLFRGQCWKDLLNHTRTQSSTLHFIGLLSDGNVHSHEANLAQMLTKCREENISKVRVHVLFDGRDVPEHTAEKYLTRLESLLEKLSSDHFDYRVASGGGRMKITMDRYGADWDMVELGWKTHVHGLARRFRCASEALKTFRSEDHALSDQYIPEFVVEEDGEPVGKIVDGDSVVFFNFRGDRAIEISQAFTEKSFDPFDRSPMPDVFYAGMMQYDGDLGIPKNYLVAPPTLTNSTSEFMIGQKLRLFACSETQKYGHVTYFWNGNNSSMIDPAYEIYREIKSDVIPFDRKPEMKAPEIAQATIQSMAENSFDFGRINFANGDMVGHTGDYQATIKAMETMDFQIGKILAACKKHGYGLIITADHGNADKMFEGSSDEENWEKNMSKLAPKTAHTISPVPFYLYDPHGDSYKALGDHQQFGLANLSNTFLEYMEVKKNDGHLPAVIQKS